MDRILTDISGIKIIDMISNTEDYKRFGLDDSKVLEVFKKEQSIFKLLIGSTSSTGNYTYIKLPEEKGVYSVRGNILDSVGKTEDQLRNKVVLTTGNTKEITITKDGEDITKSSEDAKEILTSLNNLTAINFKDLPREKVLLTVTLAGEINKTLIVYEAVDGEYPATSSEVDFPFTIPEWIVNKLQNTK